MKYKAFLLTIVLSYVIGSTNLINSSVNSNTNKNRPFSEISETEFRTYYYNINPAELDPIKEAIEFQQNLLMKDAAELEKLRKELMAEEERIKKSITAGASESELQKELESFQSRALEMQKREEGLRQKQITATSDLQEKVNKLIADSLEKYINEIYDIEGIAIVLVPMMIGYIPTQLDYSQKIVTYINTKHKKEKSDKKAKSNAATSVAKKK